jgi:hypothetical protein
MDEPCHAGPAAHTCGHCADHTGDDDRSYVSALWAEDWDNEDADDASAHTRLADLDPVPPATLDLIQPPGGVCA